MSGVPSWALREPSRNRTAEWTTLCGWMTTSMASYATSYSQWASMTSRPLFASVAESIVILAPIVHVGCSSACSGVTASSSTGVASRNGPPEAVRTRRRDVRHRLADEALPDRRVLRIDRSEPGQRARVRVDGVRGRSPAARARAWGITRWPPATSVSLLAVATTLPARSAASTGRRLTTPPVAMTTRSTSSRVASASSASDPPRRPCRRQVQAGQRGRIAERDRGRTEPGGLFGEERPVRAGRQRHDPERIRMAGQHVDRLSADRTGRADQRDATGAASRRSAPQLKMATT